MVSENNIHGRILIGHTTRNLISGLCPWGRVLIGHATRKLIGGLCPWGASFKISYIFMERRFGVHPLLLRFQTLYEAQIDMEYKIHEIENYNE